MNRGSAGTARAAVSRVVTSMRPRFMNRGSEGAGGNYSAGGVTSMRPRFMNRGSLVSDGRGIGEDSDFNEAPIHESGK